MMEIDTQVSDLQDVVSRDYGEPSSLIGTGFLPENFIPPPSIDPPSYAAAAQPLLNDNQNFVPAHDKENDLPDRPCSAFLNPHVCFTPDEFFASLQLAQVDPQTISCVQCQYNGEVVVTFRGVSQRDAFLAKSVLQINGQPFALQDIDRPLTYLQIFDCQYEMPDSTIINCLEKYCEVVHHRRGYFAQESFKHIQTGVRHYRVRINQPIPNFMRFGRIVINQRYPGQPRTCRHCNQCGHLENSCRELVCFNCEDTGHQAAMCPHPVKCNLCKSTEHKARSCPFSWSRKPASSTETSEQLTTAEGPEDQPSTSQFPPEEQPTTAENQPTQVSLPPQDVSTPLSENSTETPIANSESMPVSDKIARNAPNSL